MTTLTTVTRTGLHTEALDHVFTIGASGSSAYTFQGEGLNGTVNNPTLYLTRGKTYRFENGTGAHPIRIQSADNGTNGTLYNTGVTNNNSAGTVIVEVQHDAPDVLYYQCASHASMKGILYITGALADGGVTTAKLADNAVTNAKIADNTIAGAKISDSQITAAHLTANSVTTAKIATGAVTQDKIGSLAVTANKLVPDAVTDAKLSDHVSDNSLRAVGTNHIKDEAVTLAKLPHGTSSNNGKFLRANNGADPSFESVPAGITVTNQADNRVITATGTTDTLNGESTMTYASNTLKLQDVANDTSLLHLVGQGTADRGLKIGTSQATGAGQNDGAAVYDAINSESNAYGSQHRFKIAGTDCFTIGYNGAKGYVGINDTVPYPDTVASNTISSHLELGVPSGTDQGTTIKLQGRDGSSNVNRCQIGWAGAHNRFDIQCNGANKFQIQPNSDVSVVSGNLKIETAGKGIDFSATSDTSGNTSELLDDYEEGTWTPAFDAPNQSSTTFAHNRQHGYYTKIGNIVHVTCYLQGYTASNDGGGSNDGVVITGLPFTVAPLPATYNIRHAASFAIGSRYRVICDDLLCHAFGNSTEAKLWEPSSGNTMGQLKSNDITPRSGTNEIYFAGCYRVA